MVDAVAVSRTHCIAIRHHHHHHHLPTPTDQIQAFLHTWKEGRCDDLVSLVNRDDFEFRVTAFGEDGSSFDDHDGGDSEQDEDEFVFSLQEFLDSFCLVGNTTGFEILFEDDHQHQNLGSSFGTIRAFGSDYYVKDLIPCLVPFHISLVVSLDSHGKIQVLREFIHNVEMYNRYTEECRQQGLFFDGDHEQSKHRSLSKTKKSKRAASDASSTPNTMSNLDKAKEVIDLYCTGHCDEVGKYLSESFTMQESFFQPTPVLDRDDYLSMCRHDYKTSPEVFLSVAEVTDGNTVTMTGQGFQMIASQEAGGKKPCPVFATESFFMNFTADGKIDHMHVALQDTYFDDYAACLQSS
mmetsp:Transcript_65201/g.98354  ORF Transcript_65201/g.98354 Transcript_65201/m.98354 type:complete len:352 (+) Transcript_65201:360-1415(+)